MNRTKAITIGSIIIIFIIIILQNTEEVTIKIFFWDIDIALYYIPILMALCAGLGFFASRFRDKINKKDDYDIF
jgi:uncharacterized integral membrane protein